MRTIVRKAKEMEDLKKTNGKQTVKGKTKL
jgi:hypothetical protein